MYLDVVHEAPVALGRVDRHAAERGGGQRESEAPHVGRVRVGGAHETLGLGGVNAGEERRGKEEEKEREKKRKTEKNVKNNLDEKRKKQYFHGKKTKCDKSARFERTDM